MKLGIEAFAAALRTIRTEEFTPARINPILGSLDVLAPSLEPYLHWRAGSYTRNLVCKTDLFELMVLCWDAGAISAIHDHAGQHCWFVAHSGRFDVENFALQAGGRQPGNARIVATTTERGVTAGAPDYRGPGENEIHRVSVPDAERAISIHVYARPMSHCLVFDEAAERCVERALGYDNVRPERVLIA